MANQKKHTVRWWIGTQPDPDDRLQILINVADAAKLPARGDTKPFIVTDLLIGKPIHLRRADCGWGCQCALEQARKPSANGPRVEANNVIVEKTVENGSGTVYGHTHNQLQ